MGWGIVAVILEEKEGGPGNEVDTKEPRIDD